MSADVTTRDAPLPISGKPSGISSEKSRGEQIARTQLESLTTEELYGGYRLFLTAIMRRSVSALKSRASCSHAQIEHREVVQRWLASDQGEIPFSEVCRVLEIHDRRLRRLFADSSP